MDSSLAAPRKPQVLTMSTSASSGVSVEAMAACWSSISMPSLSTWFLGQPRVIR